MINIISNTYIINIIYIINTTTNTTINTPSHINIFATSLVFFCCTVTYWEIFALVGYSLVFTTKDYYISKVTCFFASFFLWVLYCVVFLSLSSVFPFYCVTTYGYDFFIGKLLTFYIFAFVFFELFRSKMYDLVKYVRVGWKLERSPRYFHLVEDVSLNKWDTRAAFFTSIFLSEICFYFYCYIFNIPYAFFLGLVLF